MAAPVRNEMKKQESQRGHSNSTDANTDLWTHGLICAFEFVRGHKKVLSAPQFVNHVAKKQVSSPELSNSLHSRENRNNSCECKDDQEDNNHSPDSHSGHFRGKEGLPRNCWVPIGWDRISELVQTVQVDACWEQPTDFKEDDNDVAVADVAAPYWERPVGPTWWCHVAAGHPYINSWLRTAQWLHPAVSIALRDESKLISERMKHILYEVPVRVACGLLFELLGQSAGDPLVNEDDIPIVLRSWQSQNFLVTSLHVKGSAQNINVLGIVEVQELLAAEGINMPRSIHEIIAHLACRLACWDDRLYRKSIFGAADEVELKFMDRRTHEDMYLFSIILNQEIQRLSTQVIRVKWTLHAREEIVFELLQHLRGDAAKSLLERVIKSTREMIQEQEAVRGRLFTIQDVMQSTVRAWLQDKSLTVTHNLGVFGGCGLVLSIITGLFGINVDGIPGNEGSPYAFALFSAVLVLLGVILIGIGSVYLGLKQPIVEEDVEARKLELQELVKMFQKEAECHAQVRKTVPRTNPTAAGRPPESAARYVLIG
ncbi:hypothetical protein GBA52_010899 [Prunus armeniaca]|nr:hypothetical protein GBA52_010899 [Prunus armeniaca]